MKTFFIVLAVIVAVQAITDQQKEKLKEHGKLCIQDTGIDKELVVKVRGGDFTLNDPSLHKFSACMLKKIKAMDDNGVFDKTVLIAKVEDKEREAVTVAIEKCLKSHGTVTESNAWDFVKCYHEAKPDHAII